MTGPKDLCKLARHVGSVLSLLECELAPTAQNSTKIVPDLCNNLNVVTKRKYGVRRRNAKLAMFLVLGVFEHHPQRCGNEKQSHD
jgi:limonene-1,2-epoxide hydrolase